VNVMWTWLVVTMIGLLACMAFGAWPLVVCRRLAPVWRGLAGSAFILIGTLAFAGVFTANACAESEAKADEKPAEAAIAAAAEDAAAKEDSAPSSSSEADPGKPVASSDDAAAPDASGSESPSTDAERADSASAGPSISEPAAKKKVVSSSDEIEIETQPEGVIIPPGRPAWVEGPPMRVGEVHTTAISSGPFARAQDCWREFDNQIVKATDDYIAEHLEHSFATQFIHYDAKTIRTRFLKPENIYQEQIVVSIGPMHQVHGLLEFNSDFRRELEERWAQVTRFARVSQVGLGSFAFLALLGVVFSYFRLDNATRGYYTGRLQFLTAAAILAVVGVGIVAARWVVWL